MTDLQTVRKVAREITWTILEITVAASATSLFFIGLYMCYLMVDESLANIYGASK